LQLFCPVLREKILKQDRQIRATTGLNQQRFDELLPSLVVLKRKG